MQAQMSECKIWPGMKVIHDFAMAQDYRACNAVFRNSVIASIRLLIREHGWRHQGCHGSLRQLLARHYTCWLPDIHVGSASEVVVARRYDFNRIARISPALDSEA